MFFLNDDLSKSALKLKKITTSKDDYLIEHYKKDYANFHRTFLHSGVALGLEEETFNKLIDLMFELQIPKIILDDMYFFRDKVKIYKAIDNNIKENLKNFTAEEIIGFFEYSMSNMDINQISYDLKSYSTKVHASQRNFILSHYYDILIELIQHTIFSKNQKKSFQNKQKFIYPTFNSIAQKYSLNGLLLSVCTEQYKPILSSIVVNQENTMILSIYQDKEFHFPFKTEQNTNELDNVINPLYMMFFTQSFWKPNQIQRDLTDKYLNTHRFDIEETINIMKESGCIRYDEQADTMYVNYTNKEKFFELKEKLDPEKILSQIYSIDDTTFMYNDRKYTIRELVDIYLKIQTYADIQYSQNIKNFNFKSHHYFDIDGAKSFLRKIKLTARQNELLDLFLWDINNTTKNKKQNQFKPLLKIDNLLYLLPSLIQRLTLDTVIDSILSVSEIEKTLSQKKGFNFEKILENFFLKNEIKFFKLEKDELTGSSEIDGMFLYNDSLFVYEAKASIIQQNVVEMYDYLHSTIYGKAYKQLIRRIDYITTHKTLIEKKFDIRIDTTKIYPMIVMNHATYTGYQGFSISSIQKEVAIVDYRLLKYTIEKKQSINWSFNDSDKKYKMIEKELIRAEDFYSYLQKPYRNLQSLDTPTIQITENGIAFVIVQEGEIDYFPL